MGLMESMRATKQDEDDEVKQNEEKKRQDKLNNDKDVLGHLQGLEAAKNIVNDSRDKIANFYANDLGAFKKDVGNAGEVLNTEVAGMGYEGEKLKETVHGLVKQINKMDDTSNEENSIIKYSEAMNNLKDAVSDNKATKENLINALKSIADTEGIPEDLKNKIEGLADLQSFAGEENREKAFDEVNQIMTELGEYMEDKGSDTEEGKKAYKEEIKEKFIEEYRGGEAANNAYSMLEDSKRAKNPDLYVEAYREFINERVDKEYEKEGKKRIELRDKVLDIVKKPERLRAERDKLSKYMKENLVPLLDQLHKAQEENKVFKQELHRYGHRTPEEMIKHLLQGGYNLDINPDYENEASSENIVKGIMWELNNKYEKYHGISYGNNTKKETLPDNFYSNIQETVQVTVDNIKKEIEVFKTSEDRGSIKNKLEGIQSNTSNLRQQYIIGIDQEVKDLSSRNDLHNSAGKLNELDKAAKEYYEAKKKEEQLIIDNQINVHDFHDNNPERFDIKGMDDQYGATQKVEKLKREATENLMKLNSLKGELNFENRDIKQSPRHNNDFIVVSAVEEIDKLNTEVIEKNRDIDPRIDKIEKALISAKKNRVENKGRKEEVETVTKEVEELYIGLQVKIDSLLKGDLYNAEMVKSKLQSSVKDLNKSLKILEDVEGTSEQEFIKTLVSMKEVGLFSSLPEYKKDILTALEHHSDNLKPTVDLKALEQEKDDIRASVEVQFINQLNVIINQNNIRNLPDNVKNGTIQDLITYLEKEWQDIVDKDYPQVEIEKSWNIKNEEIKAVIAEKDKLKIAFENAERNVKNELKVDI